MSITVIGDVHGHYARYHKIVRQKDRHPHTVQIGDFGFEYETLKNVDANNHKVIGGNHDNYNKIIDTPHYLGDFGNVSLNNVDFFFLRGAFSIDQEYRVVGRSWWPEEELSNDSFNEAMKLYVETKPKIVLTHTCPISIVPQLLPPGSHLFHSKTEMFLESMLNAHQPELWIFGHFHVSRTINQTLNGTQFVCLDELEIYKLG
jgi:hypothetical protein